MNTTNPGHSSFKIEKGGTQLTQEELNKLSKRRKAMAPSDSESEHSSYDSNSSWTTDEDETEKSTPSNLKSNDVKRSESPDSGRGSGGEESKPTSPLLLKPANLQTKPQAPLVNKESDVNSKVQDPSTLPFKDLMAKFGEKALRYQKENVVQGL
ncbi:hypothetical protein [Wolbachia endosymbiont (group A) of Pogonocherus hispidulus]|uniref:hypothetical protein n=1 Tax=Wolbachia endosymbiont (group A) of Pogonocherus hispidulus TaxID=3066136 RepID=UPI0033423015